MDSETPLPQEISHFRLEARLGMGGMGVVYKAVDVALQRPVALKVMRDEHVVDPKRRARFLREARTAASLVHPNIATIYEVGEADGTIFIAMELVPGTSLRAVMQLGRIDPARALRWALGIAKALARAHESDVVHRDLKPDNVMVLPDDEVKLLDFGIAKALAEDSIERGPGVEATVEHSMTLEGVVMGTPQYVSPEQARGETVGVASDVFSFGTLLFELLTGHSPFRRATVVETLASVTRDRAPGVRTLAPGVSVEIERIVERCLAKEPGARFANGGELLAALRGAVERAPLDPVATMPLAVEGPTVPEVTPGGRADAGVTRTSAELEVGVSLGTRLRKPLLVAAAVSVLVASVAGLAIRARRAQGAKGAEGQSASAVDAAAVGCTSSAACSREHDGGAWRCNSVRHECVDMESQDCKVLATPTDLASDDTVWIGGLYPAAAPTNAGWERPALDLARRDFAEALEGSATRSDGLHARPIGIVLCDEKNDSMAAARHLAEDVEAPAVIGFRSAQTALSVIPTVLLPGHVLSIISISRTTELTKIPQAASEPRLIFRTTTNRADSARALIALIQDVLEPSARAAGLGLGPLKVAVVHAVDSPRDLSDTFFRELRFNNKSALENGDGFRQYAYEQSGAESGSSSGTQAVVSQIADFAPDIVLGQGRTFVRSIAVPLEARWSGHTRPVYLVDSDFTEAAAEFAGRDPSRRHRFLGVTNLASTVTNAELVLHYNLAFPEAPVTRTSSPAPSYDAFYALAYASEALSDVQRITGPDLSRALERLAGPGPPVEVGPGAIFDAFRALRSGGNINLQGADGSLAFDMQTGEVPIQYAILCLGVDEHRRASNSIEAGLVYEPATRRLKGRLHCP